MGKSWIECVGRVLLLQWAQRWWHISGVVNWVVQCISLFSAALDACVRVYVANFGYIFADNRRIMADYMCDAYTTYTFSALPGCHCFGGWRAWVRKRWMVSSEAKWKKKLVFDVISKTFFVTITLDNWFKAVLSLSVCTRCVVSSIRFFWKNVNLFLSLIEPRRQNRDEKNWIPKNIDDILIP